MAQPPRTFSPPRNDRAAESVSTSAHLIDAPGPMIPIRGPATPTPSDLPFTPVHPDVINPPHAPQPTIELPLPEPQPEIRVPEPVSSKAAAPIAVAGAARPSPITYADYRAQHGLQAGPEAFQQWTAARGGNNAYAQFIRANGLEAGPESFHAFTSGAVSSAVAPAPLHVAPSDPRPFIPDDERWGVKYVEKPRPAVAPEQIFLDTSTARTLEQRLHAPFPHEKLQSPYVTREGRPSSGFRAYTAAEDRALHPVAPEGLRARFGRWGSTIRDRFSHAFGAEATAAEAAATGTAASRPDFLTRLKVLVTPTPEELVAKAERESIRQRAQTTREAQQLASQEAMNREIQAAEVKLEQERTARSRLDVERHDHDIEAKLKVEEHRTARQQNKLRSAAEQQEREIAATKEYNQQLADAETARRAEQQVLADQKRTADLAKKARQNARQDALGRASTRDINANTMERFHDYGAGQIGETFNAKHHARMAERLRKETGGRLSMRYSYDPAGKITSVTPLVAENGAWREISRDAAEDVMATHCLTPAAARRAAQAAQAERVAAQAAKASRTVAPEIKAGVQAAEEVVSKPGSVFAKVVGVSGAAALTGWAVWAAGRAKSRPGVQPQAGSFQDRALAGNDISTGRE